jgi:hypothetical protein
MSFYAQNTDVPVERSRAEIDRLLSKNGATTMGIVTNEEKAIAAIAFTMKGARFRLELPLPTSRDLEKAKQTRRGVTLEQLRRERWRAMLLLVKSKLEIVRLGMTTVEREFLADMVLPNGGTVHEQLAHAIRHGLGTGEIKRLGR